jgi:hypothetical protein
MDFALAEIRARDAVREQVQSIASLPASDRRRLTLSAEEVTQGWTFTFGILTRASTGVVTLDDKDSRVVSNPWIRVHVLGTGNVEVREVGRLPDLLSL